jgi:hypothetical protein
MSNRTKSRPTFIADSLLILLICLTLHATNARAVTGLVVDKTWPDDVDSISLDVAGADRSVAISPRTISGHFIAEVSLDTESGGGLVLMHDDENDL